MLKLKVRKIGKALAVTLPREAAVRLKVRAGDSLFLVEDAEGYRLTRCNPVLTVARDIMARYRNTLRNLAR